MDLILSSGFLAFSRHLGVLESIRRRGIRPDAIVGTSSGALVGALVQAGNSLESVRRLLSDAPLGAMPFWVKPWQGLFSTLRIERMLRPYLPERFEHFERPFAVGVCDEHGRHCLLSSGLLMPSLMASIALPYVFPAVHLNGCRYRDGGIADRVGVLAWRSWRPERKAIVHIVRRSRGRELPFPEHDLVVIRTPRARARFWSLGDFSGELSEAQALADRVLVGCSLLR